MKPVLPDVLFNFWTGREFSVITPVLYPVERLPTDPLPLFYVGSCPCEQCVRTDQSRFRLHLRHNEFKKVSAYLAHMTGLPIEDLRRKFNYERKYRRG